MPGIDGPGIHGVQTLADGIALRHSIAGDTPRRAVIVGAGYIGLEMAEAFCALGIDTHLVDAGPQPMSTLDPDDAVAGTGEALAVPRAQVPPLHEAGCHQAAQCGPHDLR